MLGKLVDRLPQATVLLTLLLATLVTSARSAEPLPELVRATIDAAGGEAQLLRLFRMKERLAVSADPQAPGSERVSILEPPGHWWLGTKDRVAADKEPATFLVWAWTLGALVDEKSKLEALDDQTIDDRPAYVVRISESIQPPMDLYFDRETKRLVRIHWRSDRHDFSDWKQADGAWYAGKCIGYKLATGNRWYHTEILEIERLTELPAGLSR